MCIIGKEEEHTWLIAHAKSFSLYSLKLSHSDNKLYPLLTDGQTEGLRQPCHW